MKIIRVGVDIAKSVFHCHGVDRFEKTQWQGKYRRDRWLNALLKVFLSNPYVPIDTNHLERALRLTPIGRKNHLFCWSELGAEQLGILQSLMVTCRILGINPYHYLVDVLYSVLRCTLHRRLKTSRR